MAKQLYYAKVTILFLGKEYVKYLGTEKRDNSGKVCIVKGKFRNKAEAQAYANKKHWANGYTSLQLEKIG